MAQAAQARRSCPPSPPARTKSPSVPRELEDELSQTREKLTQAQGEAGENEKQLQAAREEEQAASNIIGGHSLKMEGRQRRAGRVRSRRTG